VPFIIVEQCVVFSLNSTTSRSPGGPFLNQFIPPSAQELREGHNDTGGDRRGAVYVLLMNTNGTVKSTQKIANGTGGGPTLANGENFGSAVTALGDLDGDGRTDLIVGASGGDTGGNNRGAVYVLFLKSSTTGDYNSNGIVDAADYVLWRKTLGASVPNGTGADGNRNGVVDQTDYDVWRVDFGATTAAGSSAILESTLTNVEPQGHVALARSVMSPSQHLVPQKNGTVELALSGVAAIYTAWRGSTTPHRARRAHSLLVVSKDNALDAWLASTPKAASLHVLPETESERLTSEPVSHRQSIQLIDTLDLAFASLSGQFKS
jgi:FG-GAP repeat/Dockerin type I domain